MFEAEERQVLDLVVAWIVVQVSDLTMFFTRIAVEAIADGASPPAAEQELSFDVGGDFRSHGKLQFLSEPHESRVEYTTLTHSFPKSQ